jgi:hypothetical protein
VGADITVDDDKAITVFNVYCHHPTPPPPPQIDGETFALDPVETTYSNCLVVGDFNSHSDRWGYTETDARESEVEKWEIDANLHTLNQQVR